jgi:ribonucleoside-diphosphate reductase alpha chain
MATSVIDYIFRDLAISYLKRSDLGQIKPEDLLATGTKNDSGAQGDDRYRRSSEKSSAGFRPQTAGQSGGSYPANPGAGSAAPSAGSAPAGTVHGGTGAGSAGAGGIPGGRGPRASAAEDGAAYAPARLSAAGPSPSSPPAGTQIKAPVLKQAGPEQSELIKIAQARIKGYEGDPCPACGSFTLIRNGTCMKCDTGGGTTGCS